MKKSTKQRLIGYAFILSLLILAALILILIYFFLFSSKTKTTSMNTVSSPAPLTGWVVENGKEYYYDPATLKKHFGWLKDQEAIYYLDPYSKEKVIGLLRLSERELFYFDPQGKLYQNCIVDNLVINEFGLVKDILLPQEKDNLYESMNQLSEQYGADGVSVAMIENGRVTHTFQYGYAVKSATWVTADSKIKIEATPMMEDSKIRIASISKVVLSMMALRLQEQGVLDLYSSIGDYWGFPIQNPYFPEEPVSLFSIFTHTSSISDLGNYKNIENNLRASNIFRKIRPTDPAGCSYCNYAFAVAGATVEKAVNKNLHDIGNETFFSSLNVDASFLSGYLKDPSLLAELYYTDGSVGRSLNSLINYTGDPTPGKNGTSVVGSLCISAKDMAKLVAILANDGVYEGIQYLEKESVDLMEEPYCTTDYHGVTVTQCMPLKHNTDIYNQKELYFHTGSAYGVYSLMSYNPDTKNGVVVITTGASGSQDAYGIYSVCGSISNEVYNYLDGKRELLTKLPAK